MTWCFEWKDWKESFRGLGGYDGVGLARLRLNKIVDVMVYRDLTFSSILVILFSIGWLFFQFTFLVVF